MFAVCAITLLCLVALSHSAPLACEDVARPVDQLDPRFLAGSWVLVAGAMKDQAHEEKFKTRESASVHFPSETPITSFSRSFYLNESCQHMESNITVEGSGFSFDQLTNITVTFLHTSCQDCMVMRFDDGTKKTLRMYLFSKRRAVEEKEMEEFTAQAKCMNMLPPVVMDPTKELCPEKVVREEEETTGQA